MPVSIVYALHGFLGQGSDWDQVKQHTDGFEWHTPNLFASGVSDDLTFESLKQSPGKKVFVGYSLGGRIGLSLLKKQPHLFDHYVFVSVNPGFKASDSKARSERIESDAKWADKISVSNWETFLQEWNSQSVFKSSVNEPERSVKEFDIPRLQQYLKNWSLGLQPDYSELIKENKSRITWVVGSDDTKFVDLANSLKLRNLIESYLKIKSGHRIPFDSPKQLADIIKYAAGL